MLDRADNKTGILRGLIILLLVVASSLALVFSNFNKPSNVYAASITWTGSTSTDWGTATNWSSGTVPTEEDSVTINSGGNQPTINLGGGSVTIASLSIGSSATSTLTFANGAPTTNELHVTGNVTIGQYGTMTHLANTSAQTHRLALSVEGDMSVLVGGKIDVSGKGYSNGAGPGNTGTGTAAAYGGKATGGGAYGDVNDPVDLGSGGRGGNGGGGSSGSGYTYAGPISGPTTTTTANGGNGGWGGRYYAYQYTALASGGSGGSPCGGNGSNGGSNSTYRYDSKNNKIYYYSYGGAGGGAGGCGGSGGGAVYVDVSGSLNLAGNVISNGMNGTNGGNGGTSRGSGVGGSGGNGGSGGSINIKASASTLTGQITANGGNGGNGGTSGGTAGGSGSGGRILLSSLSTEISNTNVKALAGANNGNQAAAGTVLIKDVAHTNGSLYIDNDGRGVSYEAVQMCAQPVVYDSFYIEDGSTYRIGSGCNVEIRDFSNPSPASRINLYFDAGSTVKLQPNLSLTNYAITKSKDSVFYGSDTSVNLSNSSVTWSGADFPYTNLNLSATTLNYLDVMTTDDARSLQSLHLMNNSSILLSGSSTVGSAINFNVDADVNVETGSNINVSGAGYRANNGSGTGTGNSGAGYGAVGGSSSTAVGGSIYGDVATPSDMGSGGAGSYGGIGGGLLKISSNTSVLINGSLLANGSNATSTSGGGSGGAIYLSAPSVKGAGVIQSNGGNGISTGGGGAGGRIAINRTSESEKPYFTSLSPNQTGIAGGDIITVNGGNFNASSVARFVVTTARGLYIYQATTEFVDANTIRITTPKMPYPGQTKIIVANKEMTGTLTQAQIGNNRHLSGSLSVEGGTGYSAGGIGTIYPELSSGNESFETSDFQFFDGPTITQSSPLTAYNTGGDTIVVTGTDFRDGAKLSI
ncbi:hypothetical protein CVV43_05480, partial [Candidatus Saccharibacteria bacterium HGW-Saccharibacteria-1]